MSETHNFSAGVADWREQLRLNSRRTFWVIVLFVLLYTAVGLLIDLFIHASGYTQAFAVSGYQNYSVAQPNLEEIFISLVTFKIIPWATLIMLGVALISLWITYSLYNQIMLLGTKYEEVTAESTSLEAKQLYNVIEEMKVAAGMKYMPKVFIINANYMNAFASGYSEKSAMVAITRGLMTKLTRAELQAVMAHELSHIRHGDIRLTLTASVLSNLMLMMIDILFYNMIFSGRRRNEGGRNTNILFLIIVIARFVLPIISILLLLYLSRTREYMADAGCVELQRDNGPLISALMKIHQDHQTHAAQYAREYGSTAHENVRRESYIYDPVLMGIENSRGPSDWFSTHPNLEKRLEALGYKDKIV
ncbi:MAG: zinc metalloprotease HtpX [Gammaproteobacteria bacterium RIFCSPHIGHO2_12_FULL_35_23]|nr:MAG: zinc metalloprotease HtpX [Gammaproteobacteria bacterium RIFCSPHIGHO2_12_FULL_35_23]